MDRSDEDLDREWKPNGRRPQSTMARSFSAELMDIFKIDDSISDLDNQVHQRKQTVTLQSSELQSIEAQIKEMEERLKRNGRGPVPTYNDAKAAAAAENNAAPSRQKESADKAKSRPGSSRTARPAPGSGDMPPTPVASEGEYEVVNQADLEDDEPARPHA